MTRVAEPVLDGIRELVNIGIGRSAGSLNSMIGHRVTLQVPDIRIVGIEDLNEELRFPDRSFSVVNQGYSGAFVGTSILVFPEKSADSIFFLLTGEHDRTQENEELRRITLLEVGNIIVNSVMGSITNILGQKLEFHLPEYKEDTLDHLLTSAHIAESQIVILAHAWLIVEEVGIKCDVILLLADQSIDILASAINEKYLQAGG
jgi:chemotaxis protein CheC